MCRKPSPKGANSPQSCPVALPRSEMFGRRTHPDPRFSPLFNKSAPRSRIIGHDDRNAAPQKTALIFWNHHSTAFLGSPEGRPVLNSQPMHFFASSLPATNYRLLSPPGCIKLGQGQWFCFECHFIGCARRVLTATFEVSKTQIGLPPQPQHLKWLAFTAEAEPVRQV